MTTSLCACGSAASFETCCGPLISGKHLPETAEQLMRSRYTAYTRAEVDYIKKTLAPESRGDFDPKATLEWAKKSEWKGLKILSTQRGGAADKKGVVEFIATYTTQGEDAGTFEHHETSNFRKDETGQWLFVEGDSHTHKEGEAHDHGDLVQQPIVREGPKIGRNDPCNCGSGKKYKKCCGLNAA